MRTFSVREFRTRLAELLEGDPLLIARHGRNVAVVYSLHHPDSVPAEVRRSIVNAAAAQLDVDPTWPLRSPVIAAYKNDVDRTLVRENLRRTPQQRLEALEEMQRLAQEVRRRR